jgi:hypothetical protein
VNLKGNKGILTKSGFLSNFRARKDKGLADIEVQPQPSGRHESEAEGKISTRLADGLGEGPHHRSGQI